jgi:glycerol-3-phosphate dehydrogenase (NAD(P)+)
MSMLAGELLPRNPFAILAGAMLANDIVTERPVHGVIACTDGALAEVLAHSLSTPAFELHASTDVLGVELAAVWKNAIGVIAGFAAGRGETLESKALWVEAQSVGEDLGGHGMSFTFLEDDFALALTPESRNYRLGLALARGERPAVETTEGSSALRGLAQHPLPDELGRWVQRLLPLLP